MILKQLGDGSYSHSNTPAVNGYGPLLFFFFAMFHTFIFLCPKDKLITGHARQNPSRHSSILPAQQSKTNTYKTTKMDLLHAAQQW